MNLSTTPKNNGTAWSPVRTGMAPPPARTCQLTPADAPKDRGSTLDRSKRRHLATPSPERTGMDPAQLEIPGP